MNWLKSNICYTVIITSEYQTSGLTIELIVNTEVSIFMKRLCKLQCIFK